MKTYEEFLNESKRNTETSRELTELAKDKNNKKLIANAYSDGTLLYKGMDIWKNLAKYTPGTMGIGYQDWKQGKEVYLGYDPNNDIFITGFDMLPSDDGKLDMHGNVTTIEVSDSGEFSKGDDFKYYSNNKSRKRRGGFSIDVGGRFFKDGSFDAVKKIQNLIHLKLDN